MIILTIIILLIKKKGRKKYTFFFALARKFLLNFQDFFGGEGGGTGSEDTKHSHIYFGLIHRLKYKML